MYQAQDLHTRDIISFRDLDTLQRRYRATNIAPIHNSLFNAPTQQVQMLRYDKKVDASHVLATLIIDSDDWRALTATAAA